jgi:hypothetical protein
MAIPAEAIPVDGALAGIAVQILWGARCRAADWRVGRRRFPLASVRHHPKKGEGVGNFAKP